MTSHTRDRGAGDSAGPPPNHSAASPPYAHHASVSPLASPAPPSKEITEKMIVHLMAGFREVCLVTATLPLFTLLSCFVGAVIFQADEVHETHCRVFNIVPSISAITGISPQRYFWRISIALHIGPRFLVAGCYRNHYTFQLNKQLAASGGRITQRLPRFLVSLVFWLHIIEIGALCGVTYVSNRENYPVHERIFITFMVCSLLHMAASLILSGYIYPDSPVTGETSAPPHISNSLRYKRILFWMSIGSTVGMVFFFAQHRWYCHDMAFSWFALCEYVIACSNLAFHCTTILDFPGEQLIVARGTGKLKST